MSAGLKSEISPFVRKLEHLYSLTDQERRAVCDLPFNVREFRADQDIECEGSRPTQCCLILEGFAHRYKVMDDGRRQILSFHIPGDVPDLMGLHLPVMDHNLATLAASRVGFIPHSCIRDVIRQYPRVGDALWRDTLIDAAMFRERIVGLGRRPAYSRVAHLFCELVQRMTIAGLAKGNSVQLPLTQGTVADALGLSTVHVNRVVQALRGKGLIRWEGRVLSIEDWDGLQWVAEFDPAYLHGFQDRDDAA